jgi:hypothetical protein
MWYTCKNLTSCSKSPSLSTSPQQVVFALLVPSCQQVWNKLLKLVTTLLILSDLLQGCSNKSPILSYIVTTLCCQPCNILVVSYDCIRLEQPCKKSDSLIHLVNLPWRTLLYCFTLSNTRQFYSSREECCHSMINTFFDVFRNWYLVSKVFSPLVGIWL